MRCENCNKKVDRAYLQNGKLLCWFCADEDTRMTKNMVNHGPEKGSKEAKEKMATVRTSKPGRGIRAFIFGLLDQDPNMAADKILTAVLDKFPSAKTGRRHVVWYMLCHSKQTAQA